MNDYNIEKDQEHVPYSPLDTAVDLEVDRDASRLDGVAAQGQRQLNP